MRVAFHTLGCKVNQYETEAIKEAFASRGAEIVGEDDAADVYVINSCTVTNIADRKSRQYIRRMKGANPKAFVVVTGCYAQVEPHEVADMPEVNLVIGNGIKAGLCDEVFRRITENAKTGYSGADCLGEDTLNGNTADIIVLPRNELKEFEDMGPVVSSESGMTRAYIKIQEGCDRFCAYCLIPFARGPVRSRAPEEIIREARRLLDSGYKELVLTGINTALYGTEPNFTYDIYSDDGSVIPGLEYIAAMKDDERKEIAPIEMILARLDALEGDFRIRLSSLEPTVVDKNDVERIIRFDKLCHHLHLSVQSGSNNILRSMNRHYTKEEYLDIVSAIRSFDPRYGITTDIIVGFSGETEADFNDSIDVVCRSEFARVHAFRYSPRRGTAGEKLQDAVSGNVKTRRIDALTEAAGQASELFNKKNFGIIHRVLIEEREGDFVTGYTGNYIKTYVEDSDNKLAPGEFCNVKLTQIYRDGCKAVPV